MKLCINHFVSGHQRDGAVRRNSARAKSSDSYPIKILDFAEFFTPEHLYNDLEVLDLSTELGVQFDASMFSDFEKRHACQDVSDELLAGRFAPNESDSGASPLELRNAVEHVVTMRIKRAVSKNVARQLPATVLRSGLAGWWTVIAGARELVRRGWHHIAVADFDGLADEINLGDATGYFGLHFRDPAEFRVLANLLSHPSGKLTQANPLYESAALLRKLAAIRDADIMTVTDESTAIPFLLDEDLIVISKSDDVWDYTDSLVDLMCDAVSCEAGSLDSYDLRDREATIRCLGVRLVADEASFVLSGYFHGLREALDQCHQGPIPLNSARQAIATVALQIAPAMLLPQDREAAVHKIQETLRSCQINGISDSEIVAMLRSAASRWTNFRNPDNSAYLVRDSAVATAMRSLLAYQEINGKSDAKIATNVVATPSMEVGFEPTR